MLFLSLGDMTLVKMCYGLFNLIKCEWATMTLNQIQSSASPSPERKKVKKKKASEFKDKSFPEFKQPASIMMEL